MVEIYENKEAFDKREDKTLNGVTQDYLFGFGLTLEEVASSLVGCEGCFNCHDCYNCKRCERCIECYMCVECYGCTECFRCKDCNVCLECKVCIKCEDCTECFKCEGCVECRGCFNCNECRRCVACINCKSCKECEQCISCLEYEDCKNHTKLYNELNQKKKPMATPLNTKDLVRLSNEHKKKIGEGKDTFQEGVLFGYQLQSQICCEWDVKILDYSDMTSEYIYTKGCNGRVVTYSTDLSKYNEDTYCDRCGHRVQWKKHER